MAKKQKKKKSNRSRNLLFIGVIVVLIAVFAYFGSRKEEGVKAHKLATYMTAEKVGRTDIREVVSAQGPLQPNEIVHVRSEASGSVRELLFDVGDTVAVGQPLVVLDQRVLEIDLRRAQASVEAARANLEQQKKGWLPSDKARIEEQIRSLEVDLNKYEADLARVEQLYTDGFASESEIETARYARDAAKTSLDNAKEQLEILLNGSPDEVLAYYQAQYNLAKADYDRANTALGEATINAPRDGVILSKAVTEGTVVVSSQASLGAGNDLICLIGDLTKMKIIAQVDETDIGRVHLGQKVIITVDAFEGEEFEAEVTKLNPMGNVTTTVTNFEVEMIIDNPDRKLLPNLTAYIDIVINEQNDVLSIPNGAILRSGGKQYVFVADDTDTLSQREIETGITDYTNTEVKSGVEEGERIVVRGVPDELFDKPADEKEEKSTVDAAGKDDKSTGE